MWLGVARPSEVTVPLASSQAPNWATPSHAVNRPECGCLVEALA